MTLAPAAAFASTEEPPDYPSVEPHMLCAPLFTPPGNPFVVFISGPEGSSATITVTNEGSDATIAGEVTSEPRLIGTTPVRFDVTTAADATSPTVATGYVDGEFVGECTIGLVEVFSTSTPTPSPSDSESSTPEPSASETTTSTPEPTEIVLVEGVPPTGTTPTGAVLSTTGFAGAPMAAGAAVLLVAGVAVVMVAARRTASGPRE
ncbi:hypothetical protein [Demequina subtropica]|uniref:hypothetical protein n=1 Tax=Demequina subtropica TaxID=1638989 RepID=UPI0012E0635F|nr:hypothetical protein [Demequina subtropica]